MSVGETATAVGKVVGRIDDALHLRNETTTASGLVVPGDTHTTGLHVPERELIHEAFVPELPLNEEPKLMLDAAVREISGDEAVIDIKASDLASGKVTLAELFGTPKGYTS